MPLHQVAGRTETGDEAQEVIVDNESIERDSLVNITLHTFEHRYDSFMESESTITRGAQMLLEDEDEENGGM